MDKKIGSVVESSPQSILVKIDNLKVFESAKSELQIGKYVKIQEGNHNFVLCVIQNIKIATEKDEDVFILTVQPIGIFKGEEFYQGNPSLPSPTEPVFLVENNILGKIFNSKDNKMFHLGKLAQNDKIDFTLDGDKFFSKHVAVVGSTGSGKSCSVAKILQNVVGINEAKNINKDKKKNSHIIIFDIHSEYRSAFEIGKNENFDLNYLDVEKLKLPYWLMNSEELESLFIESNEQNSHNQVSQFKRAVILNKEKYNPKFKKVTYDSPIYFNINEVFNYIYNLNEEVINKIEGEQHLPKLSNGELVEDRSLYFERKLEFTTSNNTKATKASNGSFNGEFNRFLSRFETKVNDKRLDFLLLNQDIEENSKYRTEHFEEILKQFMGYLDKSNVTIIDLSGIPFEVLSTTVSLISRIIFDFAFHYSKLQHEQKEHNNIPFMVVCEEAHNYIPRTGGNDYKAARKSIERIAKEGRKYGLSLMVVSQRPSEVSDTILAQCNNFINLRLTNINDQSYIKNLLPDNSRSISEVLPTLSAGECLVVGDSTPIPSIVKLELPNPEPRSQSIKFHKEWLEEWKTPSFNNVIMRWRKESI
ncbi:ATP-binding protein [Bacillus shivajii]|uniref:ATP-binding protein n=1 Tax=Bacillus shivajii TaxID=1983719 RepID=UPI001CFBC8D9|nr:ATP-binding protein [Bacillus shivajii]UCZ53745.1 ATP-binding protein [Bacillus shivajii]